MSPLALNTIATGVSLAMDAFSVSICLGLCHNSLKTREALTLGGVFGFFQFFMPLIGAEIAEHLKGFLGSWTPWIAAALIVWVAVNMIVEAYKGEDKTNSCMSMTFRNVIILALATSLDALAVGFSVRSTGGSAWALAVTAGLITFLLSIFGALAGKLLGEKVGRNAEYIGGGVLLVIAANIIF
ncbi:MAG: manganese efflux pump [Synergistaceae bacterium]|nr:manganese efflux pump [Synergistaceae bacterium]